MKHPLEKWFRWAMAGLVAVSAVLAGVYFFRGPLLAPHIKRWLASSIESNLGFRPAIGGIYGSYVTNLGATDITLMNPAKDGPLVGLHIQRFRVDYRLWSLGRGIEAFIADMTITIEGAGLEFDLSSRPQSRVATESPVPKQSFFLPQVLPRVHIREATVSIRGSGYETTFEGIDLETRETASTGELQLRVGEWRWTHPYLKDGKTSLSAGIRYENGALTVGPVTLGGGTLAEFVRLEPGKWPSPIPFEAKFTPPGGYTAIQGTFDGKTVTARLEADRILLAPIADLFRPPGPELAGTLSMQAELLVPLERARGMEGNLDLQLDRGRVYGLNTDRLEVGGSVKGGVIRLGRMVLRTGSNTAEAKGVAAPAETVFAGDWRGLFQSVSGRVAIDCRDVPALFSLTGAEFPKSADPTPPHRLLLAGRMHNGAMDLSAGSLEVGDGAHVRLTPSRVVLPAGDRPMKDAAIHVGLEMDISDLGLVSRLVAGPPLSGSLRGSVALSGTLGAPGGTVTATGKGIFFRDVAVGDVNLRARAGAGAAVLESVVIERGRDRIRGRGKFIFDKRALEDGDVEFRVSDLAPYAGMFLPGKWKLAIGNAPINGTANGHITVAGPLPVPGGTATVAARQISIGGTAFGDATLKLQSDGRTVRVDAFQVRRLQDRLAMNGSFRVSPRLAEIIADDVNLEIAVSELSEYTKDLLPEGRAFGGAVHGTLHASGPLTEPDAQLDMGFKGLQWGGAHLRSARVKGFSSGRRITVAMAEAEAAQGRISVSGRLLRGEDDKTFDVNLEALALSRQSRLLALDKPAHIRFVLGGGFRLNDVSLSGPSGAIHLDGVVNRPGESDLRVSFSRVTGDGWFESLVTDRLRFSGLDARARLTGPMDDPRVTVEGELARLAGRTDLGPLAGHFDLIFEKRGVTIRRFEWRGDKGQEMAATGMIPINVAGTPMFTAGPLSIDATVNLSELSGFCSVYPEVIPPEGSLHGELHMKGTWDAPAGEILIHGRRLKTPPHVKPMPPGPFDIDGRIRFKDRSAFVESARVNSPDLTFIAEGSWTGMPAWLEIFREGAQKATGHVALTGRLRVPKLGWLAEQSPGIRRISGDLEADVSVEGPLSNPAVTGTIRLMDGELRPDMDVPSIQAIQLKASATPDRLRLQTLTGELGGAPFQVTGSLQRNGGSGIHVDLRLQGENLLFYRSEGLKVRADADLTAKGALARLDLSGNIAVTDGYFLQYFDVLSILKGSEKPKTAAGFQLFSIREPPLSSAAFDVRIASRQPFKIRNNLINGAVRPDLRLTGTGEIPVLTGTVYVDSTRLALPAGSVAFDSGVIRFDRSRPDRPALDLIGKSRMAGYDITIAVEGPYDEPAVTLSSVPPLSSEDLLLLVLTGRIPESTGGLTASQRQKMNVAVYLGRDLIARWFSRQGPETGDSILDRFDVDIGRAVTSGGDDTIDAQFRLVKGFPRDGDTLYITGERDAFDFFNAGVKIVFRFK